MTKSPAQRARGRAQADALISRAASLGARFQRLIERTGSDELEPLGLFPVNAMPADALAVYNDAMARHRTTYAVQPADEAQDQLIRARHRARFGTETSK